MTETSIPPQAALVRDFVNSYDIEAGTEALSGPDELSRFLAEHAVPTGVPTARDLADAVAVREGLRSALLANHDGTAPEADLDRLTRAFPLRLDFTDEGPVLTPVQDGPRGGIATILAAVAACGQDGSWRRLKVCPADHCQWAFYDTSRNRSRTWCAMSVCGNREKTRSYRSRRRRRPTNGPNATPPTSSGAATPAGASAPTG